jgi:hypothetical protein
MLTEKCPYCGSYNDVEAPECYFCHKELPDTPGHKKKRKPKPAVQSTSISLQPSRTEKKKSPPGCLIMLVSVLFLACLVVIFQGINGAYNILKLEIPVPPNEVGGYVAYYLQGLLYYIDQLMQYPIIVVASVLMILILCYGLVNLQRWARVLALMLLIILLIANFALFVTFVMGFISTNINNLSFILILLGIGLNIYWLVWFFEKKKLFE